MLLRDGGTARIRPITPADAGRLVEFYEQVSDQSKYFRFFAPYPRLSDKDVRRFTHHDFVNRVGLAVVIRDRFIATVRYDRIDADGRPSDTGTDAEVAFLVQDAHQGRGVASALLEHIAAVAQERGIRRFQAEVLPENRKMVKVFTDAGYTQHRSFADGVVHLEFDLEPTAASLAVMRAREHRAEARSVQRLLTPRSVAVLGVSRNPQTVGRAILRDLLGGFEAGDDDRRVYAVNRNAPPGTELDGVPVHRSILEIPGPVDLAVVAVPASAVPAAVTECGAHGVQGLVVVTAGYAETGPEGRDRQRALVRQARAAGMRVIGPNAFGLINTDAGRPLNASLAPVLPQRGGFGIFCQSGAIGVALLEAAHRRGLGVSSFASVGNRSDVSGNDFLQYWAEDPATEVVLLYLESFGNPRKFTRIARRLAAAKPIVVVKGARHTGSLPPGHAVPATATGLRDATVDALFQQAGVTRVETITELYDTGEILALQPLPSGDRVAVVGNSDSLGLLTHDACLSAGLRPRTPVDLTTAATGENFRIALDVALDDPGVDAVIAVAIPPIGTSAHAFMGGRLTGPDDPEMGSDDPEIAEALLEAGERARELGKPLVLAHLALTDLPSRLRPGGIPAYPAPERAVRALAHAVHYAQWRRGMAEAEETARVPELDRIDEAGARALVEAALSTRAAISRPSPTATLVRGATRRSILFRTQPGGARITLPDADAAALLARYGIDVSPTLQAPDEETAVRAAAALGYPVALKATAPHLRHRPDLGSVRLDLTGEPGLRRAHRELDALLGGAAQAELVVQRLAPRGVDTVIGATVDPAVGAILSFGLAGAPAELLGDVAHRLVPATDQDVAGLIREVRASPLLFGWRGAEAVDTDALEEVLLRVSRLVDDLPEVASVDLEPVVVAPHGLAILGARVRIAPLPVRSDLGPRAMSTL
ncbi:GNAT family N-acetyltransferase [Streptomyces sp. CB01881]|uniref:bifunctional acetate--CoA ligase family protein/GNAT family N-acetyltransferase n=1 Tax=Streptomyces sp. CB01881 TaxID=2078691 RepID=UPI000CDC3591|nr:GNAT family N-acetyltransferase [Streptomyces sp. CB01881]AUY54169.1 acyl-CoA synthetase [Streptomyces sp. CB01881]TYC75068.1 GNAT family N-acetyltransferase [Streptomyces sp. CB01881]